MRYFTSDNHYFHRQVIPYCKRPFASLEDMHDVMARKWNEVVKPADTIYVLGDFMMNASIEKGTRELARLQGHKILVKGNHDPKTARLLKMGFNEVVESARIKIKDRDINLCHYPYPPENPDEDVRFLERRLQDDGTWLLHGHVHEAWKFRRNMINVGVDIFDFTPVPEHEITMLVENIEAMRSLQPWNPALK